MKRRETQVILGFHTSCLHVAVVKNQTQTFVKAAEQAAELSFKQLLLSLIRLD